MSKGFLVLESGEVYQGTWHGGNPRAGEVVFNTSHSGYEEIATDPSYFSQIMVMTAPMQGNYSVNRECWESRQMWIDGFVSLEMQSSTRDSGWRDQLLTSGIPILSELDTRRVVLRLRELGTPWGALVPAGSSEEAQLLAKKLIEEKKKADLDWVHTVTSKGIEVRKGQAEKGPRVAVMDFGCKENTLRELQTLCSEVAVFPSRTPANVIRDWNPGGDHVVKWPW